MALMFVRKNILLYFFSIGAEKCIFVGEKKGKTPPQKSGHSGHTQV